MLVSREVHVHRPLDATAPVGSRRGVRARLPIIERLSGHRSFAVIGLDENDLTAGLGVSAVVRDPQEVGRQAARLAIDRIAEPERPPRTVTVSSTLIHRGTEEANAPILALET